MKAATSCAGAPLPRGVASPLALLELAVGRARSGVSSIVMQQALPRDTSLHGGDTCGSSWWFAWGTTCTSSFRLPRRKPRQNSCPVGREWGNSAVPQPEQRNAGQGRGAIASDGKVPSARATYPAIWTDLTEPGTAVGPGIRAMPRAYGLTIQSPRLVAGPVAGPRTGSSATTPHSTSSHSRSPRHCAGRTLFGWP